ncbi:MAG: glyoxylase-like metal-dependent hydrolase (beta-lactamase superfamily II) [Cellvibrionaceae bacterium]|jgi:glyoxylase-like metal-dependent hydrolase (beta-lactamase superfamily II)
MFDEKSWKSQENPLLKLEDDIWQLRLPLPYALDHVNVYLIQGDSGWTLVDTGLNISKARELWETTFSILGIGPDDVEKIVVTHAHPDHFGMAGWLQERFSTPDRLAPVIISAEDHLVFLQVWSNLSVSKRPLETMTKFLILNGIPAEYARAVTEGTMSTGVKTFPHPTFTPIPAMGHIKMGNRTWDVIHAPGHADGQIIFYDSADRLFLSGDQILMKITPNVGYWDNTQPGVLQRYLDSLAQLNHYDVRIGYPGHKWLIEDWQQRITEMFAHHDERLDKTLEAVVNSAGISADGVSQAVFRLGELNYHQSRFAIAETLAHLDLLEGRSAIGREEVGGVWRFSVM